MTIQGTSGPVGSGTLLLTSAEQIGAEFGGDVNASVAAMMLLHAKETRDNALQARRAEEERLRTFEQSELQAMHDAADKIREAAWKEGIGGILNGGCKLASGTLLLSEPTKPEMPNAETPPRDTGPTKTLDGAGTVAESGGRLWAKLDEGAEKDRNSDATEAHHGGEAAKRALEDLKDVVDDARELSRTAIDFLRDQMKTKSSADNTAASIRA